MAGCLVFIDMGVDKVGISILVSILTLYYNLCRLFKCLLENLSAVVMTVTADVCM